MGDASHPDRPPRRGESCALAARTSLKRAALLFDRVWLSSYAIEEWYADVPQEVTFGLAEADQWTIVASPDIPTHCTFGENLTRLRPEEWWQEEMRASTEVLNYKAIRLAYEKTGIEIIPIFEHYPKFARFYHPEFARVSPPKNVEPQNIVAYEVAFSEIPVVDEQQISWEEVLDFRRDMEAISRYRALRVWARSAHGKTKEEVQDDLCLKLDAYSWALRKHGLVTVTGGLSAIVAGGLAGTAAKVIAMSGPDFVSGTALVVAGISVWLAQRAVELRDIKIGKDSEIAVILEAQKRFGARKG